MPVIDGECLTITQAAGRELREKYLQSQKSESSNPNITNTPKADRGLPTLDGRTSAVKAGDKTQSTQGYGSPASVYLDITV